jgi:cytochrome c biogenesis protein
MFKAFIKFLTSIKLAVILLIILAAISVLGTIIPQNAPMEKYLRYYQISTYRFMSKINLIDMYHSSWFIFILGLFTLNLLACTVKTFPNLWQMITEKKQGLDDELLSTITLKHDFEIKEYGEEQKSKFIEILSRHLPSTTVTESAGTIHFFSEKGRFTHLGFILSHLSIVLILIGGILSAYSFKGFMTIVEGETSDTITLSGKMALKKLDFSIRCDNFEILYYDNSDRPKAYKSTLTIIDHGKEVMKKAIEVSRPLTYKGVSFSQASYGNVPDQGDVVLRVAAMDAPSAIREYKTATGGTFQIEGTGDWVKVNRFVPDFQMDNQMKVISRPNKLKTPAAELTVFDRNWNSLYHTWVFSNFPDLHRSAQKEKYMFTLANFINKQFTGLQVTKKPGVWLVWIGCFFMLVGFYVIFFTSHRRIWLEITKKEDRYLAILAGLANKNREPFEREFKVIFNSLKDEEKNNTKEDF